jgi:hypothetical protein
VCLAETVRLVSNSRTSTFKLHLYASDVLKDREVDALKVFASVGAANALRAGEHWIRLGEHNSGEADGPRAMLLRGAVSDPWGAPTQADALMTSPPYGDNRTTVPYGQHSYLPLCWIDHQDLIGSFDKGFLSTTARIDSMSLGGSNVGADLYRKNLEAMTPSLATYLLKLDDRPRLRQKVLAFSQDYRDHRNALEPMHLAFGHWANVGWAEKRCRL